MKHQFRSYAEMHAAGFCPREYSIMGDSPHWTLPSGEHVRTMNIPVEMNERPNLELGRIVRIEQAKLAKKAK